jgi:outer membrane protein TolC
MRQAYAEWALAEQRHRRLLAYAQRLAELAERERGRVEGGESSGLDAQRLALASFEAQSAVALVEAEVAAARAAVYALSSALPPEALPVLPPLPAAAPAPGAEPPQITMLAAELEAARLAQRGAEKTLEPPSLMAGWQRQEVGAESLEGPLLGVSWSLPLFDRRRVEKVRAAVEVESADARLAVARRRLQATRAGALAAYRRLTDATGDAFQALAGIDSMLFATAAAFAHGEMSLTDLLETVDSARAAELSALELHGAALAAHRRLERLAGHPLSLEPEPTLDLEGDHR